MHNWSQWEPPNHPNSRRGPVWLLPFDHSTQWKAHGLEARGYWAASSPRPPPFHLLAPPTESPLQSSWGSEVWWVGVFFSFLHGNRSRLTERDRGKRAERGKSLISRTQADFNSIKNTDINDLIMRSGHGKAETCSCEDWTPGQTAVREKYSRCQGSGSSGIFFFFYFNKLFWMLHALCNMFCRGRWQVMWGNSAAL